MALDFSVLQGMDPAGAFFRGQEAVRAEADRNLLRQMQMEQMAAQRENMLAQRQEREAQAAARRAQEARAAQRQRLLTGAADALRQGGHTLNRDTLQQILASAIETDEPTLFQFATQTLKALDEEDLYKREATRFGLPGGAAPAVPSVVRQPAAAMPAAPAAPPNLLAGTPYDIGVGAPAPVNALAAPAPAAPAGFTRDQVQQMLTSPSARIREQGKALASTLPKDVAPPADVATMRALGIPVTPEGAARFYAMKRPEAPKVDVKVAAFTPASEQAQQDYIKAISKERETLRNVPDTLKNIEAAKKLIPTASTFMGTGGEPLLAAASFLNNRLGMSISTQGVTDATVLRTRLFEGILDNLKKLDSQPSQEQQRVLAQALGNLGTDPAALGQILDRIGETVRDRVDRYNVDVDEAERRGVKFPFKPQIKLPGSATGPANIPAAPAAAPAAARQVRRTGTLNGRRVIEYTDGSVEYAN